MTEPVTIELAPSGARINVTSGYRDKDAVKLVPGTRWDADARAWHAPLSWAACKQFRGVFGDRLAVGPALAAWAWNEFQNRVQRVEQLKQLEDVETAVDQDLWPPQRVGVEFLTIVGQGLLGDEMGTGKTVQVLRALRRLGPGARPVLVVCPNTVKRTWLELAAQWAPELSVHVVQGGAVQRRKQIQAFVDEGGDLLVVNWESLRLHSRLAPYGSVRLKKCGECDKREGDPDLPVARCEVHAKELNEIEWGAIVADEAHHAKDPKAKQTRALWAVAHQQDAYRYALTGTPIANHPGDLWALLHFLRPEEWPRKTAYVDRYALATWNPFGGLDIAGLKPETRDEFYSIFDSRFMRRPLDKVMPHLPPVVAETRYVELVPKQRKAYKQMLEQQIAILEGGDGDGADGAVIATNPLAVLTRLIQFASAYAELDADGHAVLSEPSCKLDALEAIADDLDEPMVVFAESRQLLQLAEQRWAKKGRSYVSVHGQVDPATRAYNVQLFQDGQVNACFVTLGAGGEGLDGLQHGARTEVWLQRSFSLLKNKQGEGRLRRGGQAADKLLRIEVVSEDTVEEHQRALLAAKDERFEEIVRDRDVLLNLLKETT